MFATISSLLLAAGLSVGQCGGYPYPYGYGRCDMEDGYGRFGTWGGYGSFGPRTFMPVCGTDGCMPYAFGACAGGAGPNIGGPFYAATSSGQDKHLASLKDALLGYQEKLRSLERKIEESDKLADLQVKQFDVFEKKLAESQAKILITIQESQTKILENRGDAVADQFKVLNERIDKLATAKPDNSSVTVLEKHLELLEKLVKDSGNKEPTQGVATTELAQGIRAIGSALNDLKNTKVQAPVAPPLPPPQPPTPPQTQTQASPDKMALPFNRGLIIVHLPADARLYLDGLESSNGTNVRTFISPELEVGKSYFYTLRVELERNGKIYTETQKIYFQPGREARVSFNHIDPTLPVISNNKKID